jgi:hypothetical protein
MHLNWGFWVNYLTWRERMNDEIKRVKQDRKSGKTIAITFDVPIEDIEIIDSKVFHEPVSHDSPGETDITFEEIEVTGCEYLISAYDDSDIDELAFDRWEQDR